MIYNLTDLHTKYQSYKLISNDIENNLLFGIAWDGENETKKYYSFKNYVEFDNLITHINRVDKNNDFLVKQRIYYEIVGNKCKPFFDIDIKDNELNFTKEQFEDFLKNTFILYFNKFMKCNICYDDILIYSRNNEYQFISSIHLIIINNQTIKYDIIKFLDYLKFMSNEPIIDFFDRKIYTRNRLFNLPYNTKLKKFLKDPSNPNYFLDFKTQNKLTNEYLVSCRFGLNQLCCKKNNGCLKIVKLHSNNILKTAFNKLKNSERQTYICCDEMNIEGWDEDGRYCLTCGYKYIPNYFNTLDKKRENDILKTQTIGSLRQIQETIKIKKKPICFTTPNEAFEFIILNLPNNFYKSKDWLQLTRILKKFEITEQNAIIWNEASCQKGNNKNWTLEKNNIFFKNIDISSIKSGIPNLKKILNKYILEYDISFDNNSNNLIQWLHTKTNILCNILKEQIADDNIEYVYEFEKNKEEIYVYYKNDGFLTTKNILSNKQQVICNFYHEVEFKNIFERQKIKNVIEFEKIEDTFDLTDNFISNDKKTFCIKAKWGSGKSHFVIKRLVNGFQKLQYRVIFLTENNALNKQVEKSFKTETFNIVSHIDNKNLKEIEDNIVCSLESIQKINFKETDILILDEFETILNHFESDTFDNKNLDKFKLLTNALKKCKKIILADADISQSRVNLIEKILDNKQEITTIQANTNNFLDYKFNIFIEHNVFFEEYKNDLKTDIKICFASSVKTTIDGLFTDCIIKFPNKIILKIDSDGAKINIEGLELKKNIVLKNLEELLTEYKVDILLYSPTIKTGVSINTDYFDKCYAYGNHSSLCVREFIQMLFRARNLKQKIINIGFGAYTTFKKSKEYISNDRISHVLINEPTITYFMLNTLNDNTETKSLKDYENIFNYDTDFFILKTINLYENYNSKTLYTQEFIIRMLYNHNIKLNYIYDLIDDQQEEIKEEIIEEPIEIINKFVDTQLITRYQYMTLLYEDNVKKLNYWEKTKAELFYNKLFINGITNQDNYDIDIYDKINNCNFYKKYMNELKNEYSSINKIINKEVDTLLFSYNDKLIGGCDPLAPKATASAIATNTHELEFNNTTDSKLVIVYLTLNYLQLDLLNIPAYFTNSQFEYKLWNNLEYKNIVKNYIESVVIDIKKHNYQFKTDTKKGFISFVKEILGYINLNMKYLDNKHTTRSYDKFIINYTDFSSIKIFTGRLTDCKFGLKLRENLITKFKKGFQFKINETEKIPAYKQLINRYDKTDYNYFTTYSLEINKKTLQLKNRISGYTINKQEKNTELFCEIINKRIIPYIFKNIEGFNDNIYKQQFKI